MIRGVMLSAMNASKGSIIFWQNQSDLTISSEFGILLRNTRLDKISYFTSKLLQPFPFNANFFNSGDELQYLTVTASIGARAIAKDGDLDAALITADTALYRAKENGRAQLDIAD